MFFFFLFHKQKDAMLSNLGQKRTLKSNSTQTFDDGTNHWELENGDSTFDASASGSDGESLTSSEDKRRFRRAANKIRIFSESVDYSHVRSKVNMAASLTLEGGAVVHSSLDRAARVRALAWDIVLCSWARHLTLTVPLSAQVYKWVPVNLMLGVTLRWTSIPSRGE